MSRLTGNRHARPGNRHPARPARRHAAARPRRTAYHHGDLRTALLRHVERIIRERGVEAVSIREVARRARVSHGAPAHHFRTKRGLLTAFATEGYDRLAGGLRDALTHAGTQSPPTQLALMGQAYVRFALDHPEHFVVMFPGELLDRKDPEYRRAADGAYTPLLETIGGATDEGHLSGDPVVAAAAAWSLVHGFASLWLSGRLQERTAATDADALAAAVTGFFVDGVIRKRPGGR